ncbi:enoyl-CoA hydratase/isomerase family protein [Halomonas sp. Bachu 37]|uniref:enoyl-CoA hydratase/isomerase family protein n=1 Tax=Halomonas kashgarensis TaxID=3084920 RepID=UPI003216596D
MTSCVHYQRHDDIGVISIDNPPVNALSHAVRSGICQALDEGQADDAAAALVIMATGRTFIAGADIREFGKPPQAPLLPDVIARLESSSKPIVAALHGTALGGGLEVALGCQVRIALPGTRVGLPEVKLGLLPGAGGTQRLPRLAGMQTALDMITSGRFVSADEALESGIVDAISAENDPLQAGIAMARDVIAGRLTPRVTGQLPAPEIDEAALAHYRSKLESEAPELFSPFRCIDAIEASSQGSLEEGLRRERELFLACMDSPQRAGLIHAFFAARSPHKVPDVDSAPTLERIALLGSHPLFEQLEANAERAGIELVRHADESTRACLVAPGHDIPTSCQPGCMKVMLWELESSLDNPNADADAEMLLVMKSSNGPLEIVLRTGTQAQQQALANTLKALRKSIVVSCEQSILATLLNASQGLPAEQHYLAWQEASQRIAAEGFCYRPSDIDFLAVEALAYPRHLGGPHRQAE